MRKININNIWLASAAALMVLAGCSKDEVPANGSQPEGRITAINVTTGGFTSSSPEVRSADAGLAAQSGNGTAAIVTSEGAGTVYPRAAIATAQAGGDNGSGAQSAPQTRATDEGYMMTFDAGDKIGLTAVKDGTILHNNIELTYNSDVAGWKLSSGGELWYYEGATYIAYYPYAAAMTTAITNAAAKTGAGIEAAIFGVFTPKTDQSAYADYTASDLMLWSGGANTSGATPKLDIALEHAMALVIIEPKGAKYIAPVDADWVYHENSGNTPVSDESVTVKVGETTYTPYAMLDAGNSTAAGATPGEADGTCRVLVKPAAAASISGGYETMGITIEWDNSSATNRDLDAGKYLKYNVTLPAALGVRVRTPQVGDYFYLADGTAYTENRILPSGLMTEAAKAGCSGVIYWLDPAKPTGQHGKIVSLDERYDASGTDSYWSTGRTTTGATNATNGLWNMDKVYTYNNNSFDGYPAFAWCDAKNGTSGTTTYASGATGVWYLPAKEELKALYAGFSGKVYEDIPGNWNDFTNMPGYDTEGAKAARAAFNTILQAGGGVTFDTSDWPYYWSSTEYSSGGAWDVYFYFGDTDLVNKLIQLRVRAVLAF